jgi:aminoglycoside 3-N-acetyltransferase
MSQSEQEPQTEPLPPTVSSLTADLCALGVAAGMTLIVHSSLKAVADWIIGGPQAVILALESALGAEGTLVMPTMTGELTEPADWQHPPVPAAWWPLIRQEMPPFMPDLTVTREMGVLAETFRKQDGVLRSNHPHTSFAAWGKHAAFVTANHTLESGTGEQSPIARIYDLDGYVLLMGVGHDNNTSLHLAEARARYPSKRLIGNGAPILVEGQRRWVEFQELAGDEGDFVQIGADFARETGLVRQGNVGQATTLLIPQRPLVDYAVQWMEQHRA